MTVRSMHIEIEQGTQQIAANRGRGFLPEEIDWILNKTQERYIRSCLREKQDGSGGFELDQAGADKIRMLVSTTRTPLPAYIVDDETYKVHLPANYQYLLADFSYSTKLCGISPTTTSRTLFITQLYQEQTQKGSAPFYKTYDLMMPNILVQIPQDLGINQQYPGYPEKKDIDFLTPWILWQARGLHWENFDDIYRKDTFIAVQSTSYGGAIGLVIDGDDNQNPEEVITKIYTAHDLLPSSAPRKVDNRLTASSKISSLQSSRYYRTLPSSPISELQGTNLYVYRDSSFIVTGVGISYIRKPRPISLSLNSDCELAEGCHQAICDLAVELIEGTVQNVEGKQLKTQDLTERVIL